MSLNAGTRLGAYEIVSLLGAGGMGEVYRARDTRLDRIVAIKVLSSQLSSNADLKARFEREARAISQLNHPNICTLHDVGSEGDTGFLVMEYLEGETLAERLRKGPLPLEQVVKVGGEIADALDKAHRAGIVHRDLKPGNVMLTKTGTKLLDFGLAKPVAMAAASGSAPLLSAAMTMASPSPQVSPLTSAGTLVGTVQYMSPEQLQGIEADVRSDVFAFGAVLYEMATGKRAFEGKSQISVASAILEKDPQPASSVRTALPPALDRLIARCLAKDREQRWQNALDVKLELEWIAAAPQLASVSAAPVRRLSKVWLAAAVLAALMLGAVAALLLRPVEQPPPVMLSIVPPEKVNFLFTGLFGTPAISPDGTRVVLVAENSGRRLLYVRALEHNTATPLQGTDGASYPFWSPDGKQIGFFAGDRLKIADTASGVVSELCEAREARGGAWSQQGQIVFGIRSGGLSLVPAFGGTPTVLTKLDARLREFSHRFPAFLPDEEHIAYVVQTAGKPRLDVVSITGSKPVTVAGVESQAAFAGGRIFHVRNGALTAQRFNLRTLALERESEIITQPVLYDAQFNFAVFSVARNATMVYEEAGAVGASELAWMDESGKQLGVMALPATPGTLGYVRISPRGDRVAFSADTGNHRADVWVVRLADGARTRLSLNADGGDIPAWSPDGDRIVYANNAADEIIVASSSVGGNERRLLKLEGEIDPADWSSDGNYILIVHQLETLPHRREIWVAPLKTGEKAHAIVKGDFNATEAALSPNGKWLAYVSDESGRQEVYVVPFDPAGTGATGRRWQISNDGGRQPRWTRKSDAVIFTVESMTSLFSAGIRPKGAEIEGGQARKLFDIPTHPVWGFYDTAPNGSIYMVRFAGGQTSPLTVLMNWKPK